MGLKHYAAELEHEYSEESNESDENDQILEDSKETNDNMNQSELLNAGWADSISKILKTKKPKGKKTIVLSKAKKLTDVKKEKSLPASFEIETEGEVKEEKIDIDKLEDKRDDFDEPLRKKKRDFPNVRIKPNILEKDRERTLQKIATKGVVQLFNAVRMQQNQISEKLKEAGPLEVKQDKVLKNIDKRAFLDVLMGEKSLKTENNMRELKIEQTNSKEKDVTWSVLKDDFMMTAKMKDWDKELDVVEEDSNKSD